MFKIYKIQDGEKIEDIASKFTTTTDDIFHINGFDRNYAFDPGQLLIVPNTSTIYQRYTVKKGDTVYAIAKKFGTDTETVAFLNGLDKVDFIYPNQELIIPNNNVEIYVSKGNDTLSDIASRLKTSVETIASENENLILIPDQIIVHKKENVM